MIKSAMNIAFIVEELCLFRISKMSQKAIVLTFSLLFQPWISRKWRKKATPVSSKSLLVTA